MWPMIGLKVGPKGRGDLDIVHYNLIKNFGGIKCL
jgi:hypothetical protein